VSGETVQAAYGVREQVGMTMIDHPHIAPLAAYALEQPGWYWYAIADSAQNAALPEAIAQGAAQVRCLLGATQGSPLAKQSPHLVRLGPPDAGNAAWQWIARMAPRQPSVSIVASALPFDALFEQLKQFTEIRLPDNYDMFFGFWDPAILGTLIGQSDDATLHVRGPVLDTDQRAMLFGGLTGWWYWDRDGYLHTVDVGDAPPICLSAPLALTQVQVDDLVEAAVPDHVLYYVDLNQAHLLSDLPESGRYAYVEQALEGARGIGLISMMDLVNYVCMTLIFGERWYRDREIADLLLKVKTKQLEFSEMITLLPTSTNQE
jgi:hypothetical protein